MKVESQHTFEMPIESLMNHPFLKTCRRTVSSGVYPSRNRACATESSVTMSSVRSERWAIESAR